MTTTIITKNSSTAGAAPLAADLVQGELAVNVTSKALYTKNASAAIVKLNTPSIVDNGDATAITIDSSENVGIGVVPSVTPTGYKYVSVGATGNGFYGYSSFGVQLTSNAQLSGSTWQYAYGTGSNTAARIDMNDSAAGFKFFTAAAGTGGSTINWTQAMTLDSSGNLLVGTTGVGGRVTSSLGATSGNCFDASFSGAGGAGAGYQSRYTNTTGIAYHAYFQYNGSGVGAITSSSTTTTYATSSDYRLKENVQPMTGALSVIAALKPCTYTWKADGSDGQGFIAHELQAVLPDAVVGEKDAVDADGNPKYQGIDTSFLVATLTAAIQEQQALINTQQAALTTLTERITALEAK